MLEQEKIAYQKLSEVVVKAMAKDPSMRWQTMDTLVDTFAFLQKEFFKMQHHSKSIRHANMISLATKANPQTLDNCTTRLQITTKENKNTAQ